MVATGAGYPRVPVAARRVRQTGVRQDGVHENHPGQLGPGLPGHHHTDHVLARPVGHTHGGAAEPQVDAWL